MSQVVAWKCDKTNKLFAEKEKYVKYLKKMAKKNLKERKRIRVLDRGKSLVKSSKNLKELEKNVRIALLDYYETFGVKRGRYKFVIDNFWFGKIRNTHSCPEDGVINWHGHKDKPTHYEGMSIKFREIFSQSYEARVELADWNSNALNFHDLLGCFNIYTNYVNGVIAGEYKGGLNIFSSDFPNLIEFREESIKNVIA